MCAIGEADPLSTTGDEFAGAYILRGSGPQASTTPWGSGPTVSTTPFVACCKWRSLWGGPFFQQHLDVGLLAICCLGLTTLDVEVVWKLALWDRNWMTLETGDPGEKADCTSYIVGFGPMQWQCGMLVFVIAQRVSPFTATPASFQV